MKRIACLLVVAVLMFSLTGCGGEGESDEPLYSLEGSINESVVIFDNEDIKLTFNAAYYEHTDTGLFATFEAENKLDKDVYIGFQQIYINGIGFYAWQVDEVVEAGLARGITFKLASADNLKMATIDKLSTLRFVGSYYYTDEDDKHYQEEIVVEDSENADYVQTVDFTGKKVIIDHAAGTLEMTFGVDKITQNEEGIAELYVLCDNDADMSIDLYYDVVANGDSDSEQLYCGSVLYGQDLFMEAIPIESFDAAKCTGITVKDLVINDFDGNELFSLDELVIAKDDLEPVSY